MISTMRTSIAGVIVCALLFMKFRKPTRIAIKENVSPFIDITRYKVSIHLNLDSWIFYG
jgi:hypothetical protein